MTRMTTLVMMKSCSPPSMGWILLFSLWIRWKVCRYHPFKHVKDFISFPQCLFRYGYYCLTYYLPCQNKSACSDAIIGSTEVSEPDPDTWVFLSSSCKRCCPSCWAEKRWDWEGKIREVIGYHRFLSFWMYILGSCFAVMLSSFCPYAHSW